MPEHAAIIYETFLKCAQTSVILFCRNLAKNVFESPGMFDRIESAALKGIKIDIITQEEPESLNLAAALRQWSLSPRMDVSFLVGPRLANVQSNFAVMDHQAYRFEPNRNEVAAHACMFNQSFARDLENAFYALKAALV